MHKAVEVSFVDDTNILLIDTSLKKINKRINRDFKLAVDWIRASKPSLNASKTEIALFKPRNKKITKHVNFRVSGQKIRQPSQVLYIRSFCMTVCIGTQTNKPLEKTQP